MQPDVRNLLDVNVLVALLDEAHVHHAVAQNLVAQPHLKIATCALTENGVLRVLNLPGYSSYGPAGFEAVRAQLDQLCKDTDHEFWPCDVTLRDDSKIDWSRVMGHNQITDVYLLALAVAHDGALATLDHGVALNTVEGAKARHLHLL
jgi:toxin-antitoxin system PIN domain toxin